MATTERFPCPRCGKENESGQSFCGSCGSPLVLTCAACGATSPLDFRFCGSCGAELRADAAPRPSGEERRVVTVLFADLVGFTSRAERLDPEDVQAILRPYYASLREQIESFGGVVEKFIGDAVMGVFGAPVAHGDDPERAVRAALRIRDTVHEMNERDSRLDLQMRIAVNTGEAIVTLDARTDEGESMVAGDVVNTASRLQTQAPTDAILAGEETYLSTRSAIDYEPSEPIVAKGKQLPVPAWLVMGASQPPGERASSAVPMIGRESELATLTSLWNRVVAGRQPNLLTVLGLPGVGKSRLAAEFIGTVGESGGRAIVGRSLPYGESGAYGAFAQQVKQVAGIFDGDTAESAADKLRTRVAEVVRDNSADEVAAHLSLMLGLDPAGATEGAVSDRHVLFFSARRFVEALGREQPTVLVFQDLHWGDASLLDLIEVLSSRLEDTPVLLLSLARPELREKRSGWGSGVQASVVLSLEPLSDDDAHKLAMRLLGETEGDGDGSETAAEIGRAAEGNPLFIEELVASVAERSSPDRGELPTSVRGIIAARLDGIPPKERSVLLDASVPGRIFWSGALVQLGQSAGDLPALLDSLEGRDMIRREPVSRYEGQQQFRFKHALIRDVAYATLPRARRREAHAAVATFLEEMHAERDSPAALGHHWQEAGNPDRAVEYFITAAEQASRGWAKEEAVDLFRRALSLVQESDRERFRKLRMKLAVAEQMLYHVPDAQQLARDKPDPSS